MEKTTEQLLVLLKKLIYDETVLDCKLFANTDWDALFNLAAQHSVLEMIYKPICSLPKELQPEVSILSSIKSSCMGKGIKQAIRTQNFSKYLREINELGLTPVLVKGIVLSELYPEPYLRSSSDFDLLFYPDEIDKAEECLISLGFVKDESEHEIGETSFSFGDIVIDLHERLWEENYGCRMEKLQSFNITDKKSIVPMSFWGVDCYTLGRTEQLIYLAYHMTKHFYVAGAGFRHLLDLILYVNRYSRDIDFFRFWSAMDSLGYSGYIKQVFSICSDFLGLDSKIVPNIPVKADETAIALLNDIAEAGINGSASAVRWKSGRILRQYYENEDKKLPKTKIGLALAFLFPNKNELEHQRIDVQKKNHCLPVAIWKRLLFFFSKWKEDSDRVSFVSRVRCAHKRTKLIASMNLMDKK